MIGCLSAVLSVMMHLQQKSGKAQRKKTEKEQTQEQTQEQTRILFKLYQEMKEKGYAYQLDSEIADELYSLVFIDSGQTSCQNDQMTQKLLDKHIYARWIKLGTIHAVTHHSMVCITGEKDEYVLASVVNPFLSQYVQMAILVLVQRASIINFDQRSADLTRGVEKRGKPIERKKIISFLNLQEAYVSFQNQLLFFEVTAQEQGIEIYEMLSESLYVEKEKERLDQELQNLYEAAVVNQDIVFNKWALIFAIFALFIALPSFFNELGSLLKVLETMFLDNFTAILKIMQI